MTRAAPQSSNAGRDFLRPVCPVHAVRQADRELSPIPGDAAGANTSFARGPKTKERDAVDTLGSRHAGGSCRDGQQAEHPEGTARGHRGTGIRASAKMARLERRQRKQ